MTRCPSDVDPRNLHVEPGKRRRRRKRRDLPDPPEHLKAGEAKSVAALRKMPGSPGILLEPRKDGQPGWVHTAPHSDWDLWDTQLHEAFGTRSRALVKFFLSELKRLCRSDFDHGVQQWKTNETDLNAVLALITDIRPRNAAETALAAQMVAVHLLTMNLARDAFNSGGMVMEKNAALMSKLARTYTMQLEQLRLMRGGKRPTIRQAITVKRESHYHQHQHLHDHRGGEKTEGQPHEARADAIEGRAALPSPEPRGEVVRLPSRKRKTGL